MWWVIFMYLFKPKDTLQHSTCRYQDWKCEKLISIRYLFTCESFEMKGLRIPPEIHNRFVKPQHIEFKLSKGENCYGLLYLAPDNKGQRVNAPVMIMVHGGPTGTQLCSK